MDAFSLALIYGMFNFTKKEEITLSIIVGLYHFFMPLLGYNFGNIIFNLIKISPNIIVTIVFSIIGIEMIIDTFKEENKTKLNGYIEMLSFGFAVSIDSFSTGIGIKAITNSLLPSFITFSLISGSFTYIGLILGKKISDKIGKLSNIIGAVILLIIGITYLFK